MPSRRATGVVLMGAGAVITIGCLGGTLAPALGALFGPTNVLVTSSSKDSGNPLTHLPTDIANVTAPIQGGSLA